LQEGSAIRREGSPSSGATRPVPSVPEKVIVGFPVNLGCSQVRNLRPPPSPSFSPFFSPLFFSLFWLACSTVHMFSYRNKRPINAPPRGLAPFCPGTSPDCLNGFLVRHKVHQLSCCADQVQFDIFTFMIILFVLLLVVLTFIIRAKSP
jgi:hypothetical protein